MHELVHHIALLIRFPLNQQITLERLERGLQVARRPFLSAEDECPPRLIRQYR